MQEKKEQEKHYVYIVECSDGSFYTGWTPHLEKRIEAHSSGKGAKYTKGRTPVHLRYFEMFETKGEALSRECAIKRMTRAEKQKLIEEEKQPHPL